LTASVSKSELVGGGRERELPISWKSRDKNKKQKTIMDSGLESGLPEVASDGVGKTVASKTGKEIVRGNHCHGLYKERSSGLDCVLEKVL